MKSPLLPNRSIPLDFLRGLAILLVLGVHFNAPAPRWAVLQGLRQSFQVFGGAGVDLFFVLSGFLVAGLLMNEYAKKGHIDARRFLFRRAFKIWPQYYAFILISMALSLLYRDWARLSSEAPNLLHLQNYLGTPHLHTWSLAVEEHFYLVLVALLGVLSARKTLSLRSVFAIFLAAALLATLSRFYYVFVAHEMGRAPAEFTHSRIDTLALGVLLAAVFHFRPDVFGRIVGRRLALGVGLGAALVGCWAVSSDDSARLSYGFTLRAVASACLFLLVYGSVPGVGFLGKIQRRPAYRSVAWIGQSSYGIYLWHIAIARPPAAKLYAIMASRLPMDLAWVGGLGVWIVVAIAGGYLSTRIIEAPFLRFRDRKLAGTVPAPDLDRSAHLPEMTLGSMNCEPALIRQSVPPDAAAIVEDGPRGAPPEERKAPSSPTLWHL